MTDRIITITPGLWRGFEVAVEPPSCQHPLKTFRSEADALAFAEELSGTTGWLWISRIDRAHDG